MARDVNSAVGTMEMKNLGAPKQPKKPPKVIDHIRIHPQMGGGVTVAHHYTSMQHEPKVHNFGMTDGSGFQKHIASVTGMPMDSSGETEATQPNDEAGNVPS
jgi:hypothetical protein